MGSEKSGNHSAKGNQGWSTKGRAGRPKTEERPRRWIRLHEEEWELVKAFAEIVKADMEKAKKLLENHQNII